jgi:type IV pilus assembly protein PilM
MASSSGVWGIEVGQSALKALRCTLKGGEVVAEAFDYIEYPKILSQPEADPDELIREAIQKFLERNDSGKNKVCLSVPGQSGLAKFFKPPPVEVKKVADIVRYEARQQIPFDLNDVVWDYQMMPGSTIEEGYALESEVGLFAMKREMVYRQLQPLDDAGIEVDVVQLAPMAIYNMLAYDRMHERLENDIFDVDNPPPSSVLLSIGTDSSDLIVTNGFRLWQRSMPIGGNHFTRQLTKDLKLTFSKAEHLKRNAREAVDPKMIFQTMRPVFNDLVTEVQRSIGFFRSLNRKAEINELLVTGNTVKMPGLAAYLGKNLGFDVHVLDRFNRLTGDDVLTIPTFRDNAPTFAVCYGLCLQGLGQSQITASLVPREIVVQRIIRAKKPWTVAACATLMAGMVGHYAFTERSWAKTHPDLWSRADAAVKDLNTYSGEQFSSDDTLTSRLNYLNKLGEEVASTAQRRLLWMEVIRALNEAVPRTVYPDGKIPSPKKVPFEDREDIHILSLESKKYDDLTTWYTAEIQKRWKEEYKDWLKVTTGGALPEAVVAGTGPTGAGWVFEMRGYHYYNSPKRMGSEGSNHVRKTFITNLMQKPIDLPDATGKMIRFMPAEIGLSFPLILNEQKPVQKLVPNPDYDADAIQAAYQKMVADGSPATPIPVGGKFPDGTINEPQTLQVLRHDFIVQIVWQETSISERLKKREEKEAAEKAAAPPDPNAVAVAP